MDATQANVEELPPESTSDRKLLSEQRLRKNRLGMSFLSYMVTLTIVTFCWYQGMVPVRAVFHFAGFAVLVNAVFLFLIHTNINLKFRDPSMTSSQMVVSILPALWVMYFLDAGQARAVFLLIAIVPALYGILALNTRQFLVVSFLFFLGYGGLIATLWWTRPEVMVGSLELIQMVAFVLVMGEIAVIGGYINGLREKLRKRNDELKQTLAELNDAMAKISDLANRDALTGVFNRRHLFDVLCKEANRRRRTNGPFSVCILDIDYFKQVNDTHGHQAGDEVLRRVAADIGGDLRSIDCFGRYGGEEFLMVLPQTPLEGARIKAERVRKKVEDLLFPTIGENFRVTVSIGIAEYRNDENVDDTIARADAALYRAKASGRNRVVSDSELASVAMDAHGQR